MVVSRGSVPPGNRSSIAGSISRSMAMKSILSRNRSAVASSTLSLCAKQYLSSAGLKRVLTGTVTAPSRALA